MKIQSEKQNVEVTAFRELGHTNGRHRECYIHRNCPIVVNDKAVTTDANANKQLEK